MFGDFVDVSDCGADHEQRDKGQYRDDRQFREELAARDAFAFALGSSTLKEGTVVLLSAILLDKFLIASSGVAFGELYRRFSARWRWCNEHLDDLNRFSRGW